MRNTYLEVIRGAHGDGFQLFIQESADRNDIYAGSKAYIMVPTENPDNLGDWDQNMLFLAEISGDFHCMDGGIEAFRNESKTAVIYMDRQRFIQYAEETERAEILYQTEEYVLLGQPAER